MFVKFQSNYKGYKVVVDFLEQVVLFFFYFFGLWLGDGFFYKSNIINQDEEVVVYLEELVQVKGLELVIYKQEGKFLEYWISNWLEGWYGYSIQGVFWEMEVF